jgi:SAM-dependent methyltransferase
MAAQQLRLYSDLARWWPLMSPPAEYVEEAADLLPLLLEGSDAAAGPAPGLERTLLEPGCGGGSLAYHLKGHFRLTLTDRSPGMLAVSQQVNPECEHLLGDMTTLDLGRQFDRVLVHDAIMYATDPDAVRATLRTAARHCRTGGVVVVLPDCVRETFEPSTESGGEDGADGRGLRYLMWTWDPDPADDTFGVTYAFLLRETDGQVTVEKDQHREGCFPRADWLTWFENAGLRTRIHHDPWNRDVFVGVKRD